MTDYSNWETTTMLVTRTTFLAMIFMVTSCMTPDDSNSDDPATAQVELCKEMCLKPLCSGIIEPGPDFEEMCMDECTMTVSTMRERSCSDRYQTYLECLDGLSCEETQLWLNQQPNYPCLAQEDVLASECDVEVRDEGG